MTAEFLEGKPDVNGTTFQEAATAVGYGGKSHKVSVQLMFNVVHVGRHSKQDLFIIFAGTALPTYVTGLDQLCKASKRLLCCLAGVPTLLHLHEADPSKVCSAHAGGTGGVSTQDLPCTCGR